MILLSNIANGTTVQNMPSSRPEPIIIRSTHYYFHCSWLDPLFCVWFKKKRLDHPDLYAHPPECDAGYLHHKFMRCSRMTHNDVLLSKLNHFIFQILEH